jgi:hypothetical protein
VEEEGSTSSVGVARDKVEEEEVVVKGWRRLVLLEDVVSFEEELETGTTG